MKMRQRLFPYAAGLAAAAVVLGSASFSLAQQPASKDQGQNQGERHIRVCAAPGHGNGAAECNARVVVDAKGAPKAQSLPSGYGPAQFRGAYGLTGSSSKTIAIVDAYNDPNIKSDLDKYDSTYGLPFFPDCSASVTASCFQKVNQRGGTSYPATNSGWALEIALDVEVAHGICPTCKLLLVEADSNSYANLFAAVDRAVAMNADVVSMSWGSGEFSGETSFDSHFNVSGVAFTTSSGDSGFGSSYPAASPKVTAVGGTSLSIDKNNNYVKRVGLERSGQRVFFVRSPAGFPDGPGVERLRQPDNRGCVGGRQSFHWRGSV